MKRVIDTRELWRLAIDRKWVVCPTWKGQRIVQGAPIAATSLMGKPFRIVMQMIDFGMFVYERSKRESATDRVNRLLAGRYTATWPEGKTALKIVAEAKKRLDAKQ